MAYDPDRHNRRSIRLPEYDYRSPGAYFVTTCTADRICLFGHVVDGRVQLNEYGRIVAEEWYRTEEVRDRVVIDTFVVMPNHTHGVIVITDPPDADPGRGSSPTTPYQDEPPDRTFGGAIAGSLSTIMRQFKSMVTKRVNRLRDTPGAAVWQRNFYERVVRNRDELDRIREYIRRNPAQWHRDRNHPDRNRGQGPDSRRRQDTDEGHSPS